MLGKIYFKQEWRLCRYENDTLDILHNTCSTPKCFLLEYINEFSGYLKYIVFANSEDYELLDIKNIPTLLQNIPTGLKFGAGRCKNIKLDLFIDI